MKINQVVTNITFYHVTPVRNLPKISREGLVPKIGKRARLLQEPMKGIYLFHSVEDAEDAVMGWLGDQFGEDVQLALLAVEVPSGAAQTPGAGYEVILTEPVPSQNIKIVSKNL